MNSLPLDESVNAHYGRTDLGASITASLRDAGKDPNKLSVEELAPLDQFHTRGREATLELARRAGIKNGRRVLDVGGGIGGAARTLASLFDCNVTVLDLTEEYCRIGELLTRATNLNDRVTFRHGSALDLPYPDASFDLVWMQHSSMNIADKERLYAEIFRVLQPGGRLALHEIMAGTVAPIYFPVPWARSAAISYLRPASAVRELIAGIGFKEISWVDESELSQAWFKARAEAIRTQTALPLGLHLLLGADFRTMFENNARNLSQQRIVVIQAVFERPSAKS